MQLYEKEQEHVGPEARKWERERHTEIQIKFSRNNEILFCEHAQITLKRTGIICMQETVTICFSRRVLIASSNFCKQGSTCMSARLLLIQKQHFHTNKIDEFSFHFFCKWSQNFCMH